MSIHSTPDTLTDRSLHTHRDRQVSWNAGSAQPDTGREDLIPPLPTLVLLCRYLVALAGKVITSLCDSVSPSVKFKSVQ